MSRRAAMGIVVSSGGDITCSGRGVRLIKPGVAMPSAACRQLNVVACPWGGDPTARLRAVSGLLGCIDKTFHRDKRLYLHASTLTFVKDGPGSSRTIQRADPVNDTGCEGRWHWLTEFIEMEKPTIFRNGESCTGGVV